MQAGGLSGIATKKSATIPAAAKEPAPVPAKKAAAKRPAVKRAKKTAPAEEGPPPTWVTCVRAVQDKKGEAIRVLDLRPVTTFADFFVLVNGNNPRQTQAICDSVLKEMKERGERPSSVEGYENGEWILADYGDLVIHIFDPKARSYYDLDRLWRDAPEMAIPPDPRPDAR